MRTVSPVLTSRRYSERRALSCLTPAAFIPVESSLRWSPGQAIADDLACPGWKSSSDFPVGSCRAPVHRRFSPRPRLVHDVDAEHVGELARRDARATTCDRPGTTS